MRMVTSYEAGQNHEDKMVYDPIAIATSITGCKGNNFSLVMYTEVERVKIPYCSKNMIPCENGGRNIGGLMVCNGALRRDIEGKKGNEKKVLEKILEGK